MADLNALIAQGIQFREPPNPFVQYGQMQQLQQGEQANQLGQMKMGEYQRGLAVENQLRQRFKDAPETTSPRFVQSLMGIDPTRGMAYAKTLQEQQKASSEMAKAKSELIDAKLKQSRAFLEGVTTPEQYLAWHQANHADPIIGPELVARGVTQESALNNIRQKLSEPGGFAQLLAESKLGVEKFGEMNKPSIHVIDQNGQRVVTQIPGMGGPPVITGTYADVPLPEAVQAQKAKVAKAGASNVNISTGVERKYGEIFGTEAAKGDMALLDIARKAPEQAADANRILDLAKNPKIFTGTAAELKMNLAKALNMTGATDLESAANTEALISGMSKATINAIKASGLGAGQGFTDKDLKFLQSVAGGNVTLEKAQIIRLAELQHKAAEASARKWEDRKKNIPKTALEGTGLEKETITVPPLGAQPGAVGVPPDIADLLNKHGGTK